MENELSEAEAQIELIKAVHQENITKSTVRQQILKAALSLVLESFFQQLGNEISGNFNRQTKKRQCRGN